MPTRYIGMMHEAKVNILAKPHPYIFFTLQLDMHGGLPKTYHKFTTSGVATPGPARATSFWGPGNNYFESGLKFNCMSTWQGGG